MEHWVEVDQMHSKGKSPPQNMVVFFFKNRQEQLMWQKIIMSSCNKTFKQVLSFQSDISFIYTSDSTLH